MLKKEYTSTVAPIKFFLLIATVPWATCTATADAQSAMASRGVAEDQRNRILSPPPSSLPMIQSLPMTKNVPTPKREPEISPISDEEAGIQGNWMKKKDWLSRAYELNDEIKLILVDIQTIRTSFSNKYDQIDKELDSYYKDMGLSQGILNELFASIEKYLEKKKAEALKSIDEVSEEEEKLSDRDRETQLGIIDEKMMQDKTQLKQLKFDMKSIEDLDKSLNDRLKKMNDQIVLALDLDKKGKELLDTLWHIIDHNKAETLYYKIKNEVIEKLKAIQTYLKTTLSQDFDTVITTIRQQIGKTKEQIQTVEQDGLVIKDRATRIQKLKQEKLERIKAAQLAAEQEAARPKRRRRRPEPTSWYSSIVNWTATVINTIKKPFTWIFGSSEPPETRRRVLRVASAAEAEQQATAAAQPKTPSTADVQSAMANRGVPTDQRSLMPGNAMPGQQNLMPFNPAAPDIPGIQSTTNTQIQMPMEHEG